MEEKGEEECHYSAREAELGLLRGAETRRRWMGQVQEGEGEKKVDFNTAYFIHAYNPAFAR